MRQVDADEGLRPDLRTAAEPNEVRRLYRKHYELRRANDILKAASALTAPGIDVSVKQ